MWSSPKPRSNTIDTVAKILSWVSLCALCISCENNYAHLTNIDSQGSAIVCFGDSITRGHGASPGMDYPSQLSKLLGRPVVNAGKDGDTTATALARIETVLLKTDPRLVIIELGGNDFLNSVRREITFHNLERIVKRCTDTGAMVVILHAKLGLFADPYRDGFASIADKHNALLVTNTLKGILGHPSRMYDQIHPNDVGYTLFAERVAAVVRPLLEVADHIRLQDT